MNKKITLGHFVISKVLAIGIGLYALAPLESNAATSSGTLSPVTPKDVVYQIITDRFVDGDTSNNIPAGSSTSLFDDPDQDGLGNGDDLKLYQGGDWQGIVDKISYLKDMGITAVWISAPYANRDTPIYDYKESGGYDLWTSFHGYHVRNYFATNKHFGLMQEFEALRDALHANGIKLIIDFVSNHTSRGRNPTSENAPEDGKLYEPDKDSNGNYVFDSNGNPVDHNSDGYFENLLADPNYDTNYWFHNLGDRGSDDTQFGFRFRDLGSLSDFSTENAAVVAHLEKAAKFWKSKGVDGFRHDATLHMSPSFAKGFKDAIDSANGGPVTHFGEFFIGRPDPKYDEYQSFPDRTGINNLDFEYFRASTNAFGNFTETMSAFGQMMTATSADYEYESQAVTFLDNHDVTRFRYIQPNNKPYHAALATLLTARGTPNIYYGTEQYLTSADASDISGRVFMEREVPFDQATTAYKTIQLLSALRQQNEAVAFGETAILYSTHDVLVFKRQFYNKQVVVAVNRQPDQSFSVPAINTTLPAGNYSDVLSGLLFGDTVTVGSGQIAPFTLEGGEVSVWSYNPDLGTDIPRLGNVVSTMGRAGNTIYLYGTGLGGAVTVKFGSTAAAIIANSNTMIKAVVPSVSAGVRQITVTKGGNVSNPYRYEVLSDDQNQIIFKVNTSTSFGQNVYIVGDIPELGNWDTSKAVGPFHNPNYPEWFLPVSLPKLTTVQYKFIKKDDSGNLIWEGGSNRSITSSSSATGTLETSVLTWQ